MGYSNPFARRWARPLPPWAAGILFLLWLALGGNARGQDATRPERSKAPVVDSGPQLFYSVRPFMSEEELEQYAERLHLSPAQRAMCRVFCERHRDACESQRAAAVEKLKPLSRAPARERQEHGHTPKYVTLLAEFKAAERAIQAFISAKEDDFFDQLAGIMVPAQLELLPRIRLHRARARRPPFGPEVASARIDVAALCESLPTSAAVDAILREYEELVTPKLVRLDRMISERNVRVAAARSRNFHEDGTRRDPTLPESQRIAEEASQAKKAANRPAAAAQAEIESINDRYVERLVAALDGEPAAWLRRTYDGLATPHVHPDPVPWEDAIEDVLKSEPLGSAVREAVAQAWKARLEGYAAVTRRMEARSREWGRQYAITMSTEGLEPYREEMTRMQQQRWNIAMEALREACTLMPQSADGCEKIQAVIAERLKRMAEMGWPSPAPWLRE